MYRTSTLTAGHSMRSDRRRATSEPWLYAPFSFPAVPKRAVVLLSGGVDSTTTLAIAKAEGFECHALSFNYGQRHGVELEAARRVALTFGVTHKILDVDLRAFGGSALTDDIAVPKDRPIDDSIPVTYVPAR